MNSFKILLSLMLAIVLVTPATSQNLYEYRGQVTPDTRGARLLKEFTEQMKPEMVEMILDEEPDDSGRVRYLFMDMKGPIIGGVRIERLTLDAFDVQFTPPSDWKGEEIEILDILLVHANTSITEKDVNETLSRKAFGDDEHWHDLQLDFRPEGIYARGKYLAKFIIKLDILIEIMGDFKIVKKQQIWLDNCTIKVNRVAIPETVTDRAISKIQPVIDLSRFIFPLELDSVKQDEERIYIRSRILPEPFDGITYRYFAAPE